MWWLRPTCCLADLAHRRAAELAAPDDQRVVEQAALLQVADQRRRGPVDLAADLSRSPSGLAGVAVVVPVGVVELDEAHAALDQPAGQQAVVRERRACPARRRTARASLRLSFERSISSGRAGLHAVGHLVGGDARGDLRVAGLVEPWPGSGRGSRRASAAGRARVTPGGLDRSRIGSPPERNGTPW